MTFYIGFMKQWNNTAVDYPPDICLHQLFEAQVERTPNSVAVVFEGRQLTYEGLNQKANQLAHYLQNLGIGPSVLVGICLERSLEMVISLLGILKAGGAYVPIDPAYPIERIAYMLENSQVSVLLTQKNLLAGLPKNQSQIICLDGEWDVVNQENQFNLNCTASEENLAYVIYTSGSTGKPKGVAMKHLALSNLIFWQLENTTVSPKAKTLQFAPISFDVSFQEIFSTWCGGGTLVLISEEVRRDPVALLHLLREKQIQRLFLPFVALQLLAEAAQTRGLIPTSLVEVITAGEQLQITRAIAAFFSQLKDCSLHNQYGPSETHVVTAFTLTGSTENWSVLPPIGRPIANTQIYLLDQSTQPVSVGIPGELYIGGVSLALGYLNRPDLTAERFIPNPFSQEQESRLYKTGDLARYLPDGNIEYLGRIDNQVKVRGFRIELGEIEAVLAQHPNLRQVAVIVREEQPGDKRLVAYVCPHEGKILTSSELYHFLGERLPEYMVPSTFVMLEALPLTPSGKVDRRALPIPVASNLVRENSFVAPRDLIEQQLAQIWSEVLGISPIGVYDNFIELGGHSLLATKIIGLVRARLQVELPLNRLFECPTVAKLGKEVLPLEGLDVGASLQPIPRDPRMPISFSQEQMWFLNQLTPEEPVCNESLTIHLGGDIDIPALEESLTELIRRHEILRTTYRFLTANFAPLTPQLWGEIELKSPIIGGFRGLSENGCNGQPCQEIQPPSTFTLPIVDLRQWSETARETEALRIATEQLRQRFDLNRGPLLRATLIQLTSDSYRLYFAIHHILVDAESLSQIVQELEIIYTAFCQGLPSPLPELPIQYADFTVWQRQRLKGEILSHQLTYWQKQLENLPQLKLPTDRPRTPQTTFTGSFVRHRLSFDLIEKLKTLSNKEGVTLFVTFATAIKVLLYRYSNQEDIVLGTVISQRTRPELEGMMGNFLNTLVLRSDLSGNPSFCELLKRVRNVCLSAYSHQDVPFQKVVEAFRPNQQVNQNPMFQVALTINSPLVTEDKLGWKAFHYKVDPGISKFDLTFSLLEEGAEGMVIVSEYNSDLFDATTIKRMSGHLSTMLVEIVTNPHISISELPLLTDKERHQLLVEWNDTQVNYPKDKCIHQLFEEQVERTPDAVAVVFEERQLTYHELNCQANQLAHYLQTLGVAPEVLVGICVERSVEMVVGLLGIIKAGGAYVPLDPSSPAERLSYILEDAAVPILVATKSVLSDLPQHSAQVVCLDSDLETFPSSQESTVNEVRSQKSTHPSPLPGGEVRSCFCNEDLSPAPETFRGSRRGFRPNYFDNPAIGVTPDNLAYVIYTSGSTGQPKGVLISHQNVTRLFRTTESIYHFNPNDCLTLFHSYAFDFSVWELWGALLYGGRLVIVPYWVSRSPKEFYDLLVQHQVTVLNQTPSAFTQLIQVDREYSADALKLRYIIFGGEALQIKSLAPWFERHGDRFPQLINMYGITETTVHVTYKILSTDNTEQVSSPIGKALGDLKIYILDRYLQPVPIGVTGELHISGAGLARGYLNRPELTAERFIPNPFEDNNSKLYKTGDLARYLPDGNLEFIGRIDNQVKVRGYRIETGEIESTLTQHPTVKQTVVVAREDNFGNKGLVAYLVLESETPEVSETEQIGKLKQYLKQRLPEYMIPSGFVVLPQLPLTPNGKLDRKALPAADLVSSVSTEYVAPETDTQKVLAEIWKEVLGIEQVGMHDNFFDLGGHSLLAVRLMAEIEKQFGKNLSLAALFQGPTLEQLAILLRQSRDAQTRGRGDAGTPRIEIPPKISLTQKADTDSWSPLVAIQPQGNHPPFFCMPGSGGNVVYFHQLARHLGNEQPFYALQPPSLDGVSEPFSSLEEVAAYYLQAIQTLQPSGPYFLGGHSFGGLLAFEMAQQLLQLGETVALLALFDFPAPLDGSTPKQLDWDDTRWFSNIAHMLEILSGKNFDISYETLKPLTPEAQLNYLKQHMETVNLLPPNSGIERVRGIVQTIKAEELAFMSYLPQGGYQGQITLFRTSEVYQDELGMLGEIPTDPTWGWNKFSSQTVEVHVVPGNHTTMLSKPHVMVLAEKLQFCLAKAWKTE
ncbi:MAG: amino acid adenylation domain-containing protein [Okeania sp. SIO2C9]|uniref:amino acid adenylation domain-containing protein n=1 Tax=Okeania sp. SIO2C9 TaxID=2607791 RepID=UPI0013C247DB|nr:non-ribosomal peptide synthetase [Okeania sp. SIO2C9]NEQ77289.1 amino acid adenylation domain-containing protein [Okeania sp. SIO2C9]